MEPRVPKKTTNRWLIYKKNDWSYIEYMYEM